MDISHEDLRAKYIQRYEERAAQYEKEEKLTGRVLLYGNSYLDNWHPAHLDDLFRELSGPNPPYVNHAIGSIAGADLLRYYPRLVRPYLPTAMIWCEGANDFALGYTCAEASANARAVFAAARQDFPDLPLVLLSTIRPPDLRSCPERISRKDAYDQFLADYARDNGRCLYLDLKPFFRETQDERFYLADQVHLNDIGYERLTRFVKPPLLRFFRETGLID
ncbi:MAG TPA: hypothetical protein DD640_03435 [Clostridiales bacterium]|nr:hypothetical protein [Clostridiales bacterium]